MQAFPEQTCWRQPTFDGSLPTLLFLVCCCPFLETHFIFFMKCAIKNSNLPGQQKHLHIPNGPNVNNLSLWQVADARAQMRIACPAILSSSSLQIDKLSIPVQLRWSLGLISWLSSQVICQSFSGRGILCLQGRRQFGPARADWHHRAVRAEGEAGQDRAREGRDHPTGTAREGGVALWALFSDPCITMGITCDACGCALGCGQQDDSDRSLVLEDSLIWKGRVWQGINQRRCR
jgi:hypothetical protein